MKRVAVSRLSSNGAARCRANPRQGYQTLMRAQINPPLAVFTKSGRSASIAERYQ